MTSSTAEFVHEMVLAGEQARIGCKHCDGTGQIDPDGHLDLDSIDAVRAELVAVVTANGEYSLAGTSRADRIHYAARAGFLASRLVWLETTSLYREEREAKYGKPLDAALVTASG